MCKTNMLHPTELLSIYWYIYKISLTQQFVCLQMHKTITLHATEVLQVLPYQFHTAICMSSDTWNEHTTSNRTRVLQDQYHTVVCMFSDAQWKCTPLNTIVSLRYQIHETNAPRPTELKFYKISIMQQSVCFQMHSENTPHSTQLQNLRYPSSKTIQNMCSAEGARQTWLTYSQDQNLIF